MMRLFLGNAMWQLIKQADAVSKLVLLILLVMSIMCWTAFFYKVILVRIKKRQLAKVLVQVKNVKTLDDMRALISVFSKTLPGYFLSRNVKLLKDMLKEGQTSLTPHDWESVQQHMHQTIDDMIYAEESYLPLLSTNAAVAPLLGLFGTVWGLVHAFIRISEKQSADIITVAPGIAEALITTLAGLIVAIPALIMFNYLTVQVRTIEQRLMLLADAYGALIQRLLVQ